MNAKSHKIAAFLVALFSVALALAGSAPGQSWTAPRLPVLLSTRTQIAAFAQNGDEVAWGVERASGCKGAVHVRSLASGREHVILAPGCFDYPFYEPALGVASGNILWQAGDAVSHWGDDTTLLTAGPGATRARRLALVQQQWGGGEFVTEIASDKAALVWSYLNSGCNMNESDCSTTYPISGAAYRLVSGARKAVPQSGPALDIAVSGNRIALLPARTSGNVEDEWYLPPANGPLAIRDLVSGELITEIPPQDGTFREVALSGSTVAVLIRRADGLYLDRYAVSSGNRIDWNRVPGNASDLSLAGSSAVFSSGREIMLLKAGSTTLVTLAVASSYPIGLSVSGKRIAWAENTRGGGRIVAASP